MVRLFALLAILASPAAADGIRTVPYDDLKTRLARIVDFENFSRYMSPGTRLEGVQDFDGVRAAERFSGQITQQNEGFDQILGDPLPPLTLAAGREFENLAVTFYFMITNHLVGHAAPGYPEDKAGGEGAIALMFDHPQSALGFRVAAEPAPKDGNVPKGLMTVTFYDVAGKRIDLMTIPLDWGRAGYGFEKTDKVPDILGITIENRDPAGIAIDDIIFDVTQPSS